MTSTRRHILTLNAALTAGAWMAPRFSIGQSGAPANNKLNLAFIGVGVRGALNVQGLAQENIVALCDVDDRNAADCFNAHLRSPAREGWRYGESL